MSQKLTYKRVERFRGACHTAYSDTRDILKKMEPHLFEWPVAQLYGNLERFNKLLHVANNANSWKQTALEVEQIIQRLEDSNIDRIVPRWRKLWDRVQDVVDFCKEQEQQDEQARDIS